MRQSNHRLYLVAAGLGCLASACDQARGPAGAGSTDPPASQIPAPAVRPARQAPRRAGREAGTTARSEQARADAGPMSRCYAGFRPDRRPRADVSRLGMLCGPSGGMTRAGGVLTGTVGQHEDAVLRHFDVASAECWRVFAAAGGDVADLEIEVLAGDGEPLALENFDAPWVVVRPGAPLCLRNPGRYRIRLRTHAGHGSFAVQVWRYKL